MAAKAGKKIKSMMQSPGQNRRDEIQKVLKPGNPLERMNDSARKYFSRQNLK